MLFDLHLLLKHLISDLLSSLPAVRSLTHHTLISNDTEGIVINSKSMILFTKYFRSHVAWSATCFLGVFLFIVTSDSEISNSEVTILIKDDVFRFNVSVDNISFVEVIECV